MDSARAGANAAAVNVIDNAANSMPREEVLMRI
jgi:hypothetical protein